MKESFTLDQIRRFSMVVVVVGIVIAISGAVRTGPLFYLLALAPLL